jgi:DNA-binding transcriptional LysR family regulator
MQKLGAVQRAEHGELTVALSVPPLLVGDLFEEFRRDHEGVSVELVESTSSAGSVLVQQRKADVAIVAKARPQGSLQGVHVCDKSMVAILPKSHDLARAHRTSFGDLRHESFILSEGGLGPDFGEHLMSRMTRLGVQPKLQLHRVGQSTLIDMVMLGFGITISVQPLSNGAERSLALVPLSGSNVVSVHVIWMESNPNPALKQLLEIVQRSAVSSGQD